MEERKKYEEKAFAILKDLFAKIEDLEHKAIQARAEFSDEVEEHLYDLKNKKGKLYTEYERMKTSGNGAFEEIKGGFEVAVEALSSAFKKARSHFK